MNPIDTTSFLEKQKKLLDEFKDCSSQEEIYSRIIELGKKCPKLDAQYKTEKARVHGCQSQMFIRTHKEGTLFYFEVDADALISQGLAYLLVYAYSGESKEVILTCPPKHIETLGLTNILTPSRANGISALYRRMKEDVILLP